MPDRLIYLASPYSAPTAEGREQRFRQALKAAAYLMNLDFVVFSPISHTHPIAVHHDLPKGWEFWKKQDEAILGRCDRVLVLTLPGWRESKGVTAEVEFAKKRGIPIGYMVPASDDSYNCTGQAPE